jgi:hypothetical protein
MTWDHRGPIEYGTVPLSAALELYIYVAASILDTRPSPSHQDRRSTVRDTITQLILPLRSLSSQTNNEITATPSLYRLRYLLLHRPTSEGLVVCRCVDVSSSSILVRWRGQQLLFRRVSGSMGRGGRR